MNIKQQFGNCELPIIQKQFIDQFDGSLSSIVSFARLSTILNPTFSYHYHYVSGGHLNEKTGKFTPVITTYHTDKSCSAWGKQSNEAESNAYLLSKALKELLQKEQLYILDYNNNYIPYDPTWIRVKKKLFVLVDGQYKRIAGLTNRNLSY